jgi:hypothetical protein
LVEALVPFDLLDIAIDWEAVAGAMEGFLPAFAKEAIDRAMRYNVARNQGKATELSTADFVAAAQGLRPQLALMEGAKDQAEKTELDVALAKLFSGEMRGTIRDEVVDIIQSTVVLDEDDDYRGRIRIQ